MKFSPLLAEHTGSLSKSWTSIDIHVHFQLWMVSMAHVITPLDHDITAWDSFQWAPRRSTFSWMLSMAHVIMVHFEDLNEKFSSPLFLCDHHVSSPISCIRPVAWDLREWSCQSMWNVSPLGSVQSSESFSYGPGERRRTWLGVIFCRHRRWRNLLHEGLLSIANMWQVCFHLMMTLIKVKLHSPNVVVQVCTFLHFAYG